jgi:hypothetical protein
VILAARTVKRKPAGWIDSHTSAVISVEHFAHTTHDPAWSGFRVESRSRRDGRPNAAISAPVSISRPATFSAPAVRLASRSATQIVLGGQLVDTGNLIEIDHLQAAAGDPSSLITALLPTGHRRTSTIAGPPDLM